MKDEPDRDPETSSGCCGVAGPGTVVASAPIVKRASSDLRAAVSTTLITVPAGFFEMGARRPRYPSDGEGPVRRVHTSAYRIARFAVTNRIYGDFVRESGYRGVAEREGWSFVFDGFLRANDAYPLSPEGTPWWRQVPGAAWNTPEGPGSGIEGRMDHPVVHVSWFDAMAFCEFTGTRLPTEAEWEKAARGGLKLKLFPWGNALEPPGGHRHNVWQGRFPRENTGDDGHVATAPVGAFPPNGYGLHNMTGNVWEWCADWFGMPTVGRLPARDPKGPAAGDLKVLRGGSHLCHASYCERYHVHSRTRNTPDSTTGHMGFRVAADPDRAADA